MRKQKFHRRLGGDHHRDRELHRALLLRTEARQPQRTRGIARIADELSEAHLVDFRSEARELDLALVSPEIELDAYRGVTAHPLEGELGSLIAEGEVLAEETYLRRRGFHVPGAGRTRHEQGPNRHASGHRHGQDERRLFRSERRADRQRSWRRSAAGLASRFGMRKPWSWQYPPLTRWLYRKQWKRSSTRCPRARAATCFAIARGEALYIGKAKSLRSRVKSYFVEAPSDTRGFHPAPASSSRRPRDVRHRHREGSRDPREQPDQGEPASLQREAPRRQGVPHAAPVARAPVAAPRARAAPGPRRRALLRAIPFGDRGATHAGPGGKALPAAHLLRSRARRAAGVPACSSRSSAAPRRACTRWIASCYAQQVHAVDAVSRRPSRRAHRRSSRRTWPRRRDRWSTSSPPSIAISSARWSSCARRSASCSITDRDQDVLGLYREGDLVELAVLNVRSGRVIDATTFSMKRVEIPDDELVAAFVREHYQRRRGRGLVPDEVIVPVLPDAAEGVAEWLTERREARASAARAQGGDRRPRAGHEEGAARSAHGERAARVPGEAAHGRGHGRAPGRACSRSSACPRSPRRIECIDISHLGRRGHRGRGGRSSRTACPTRSATAPSR